MRAKAGALCQVTKAFQHNNSYQSLHKPVGLCGSRYGSSGMCRCLFMWRWGMFGGVEMVAMEGEGLATVCSGSSFHHSQGRSPWCLCNRHLSKLPDFLRSFRDDAVTFVTQVGFIFLRTSCVREALVLTLHCTLSGSKGTVSIMDPAGESLRREGGGGGINS